MYRKTIGLVLHIAEKVVRSSVVALHIARRILWFAKKIIRVARRSLDVAKRFLTAMARIYRFGMKAAHLIVKFALNGLISIRRIYFNVKLGMASSGHFIAEIDVVFFGHLRVQARIQLNIRSISSIAKEFARRMGRGLSKLFG